MSMYVKLKKYYLLIYDSYKTIRCIELFFILTPVFEFK